jgi:mRNA-degrading endonuclease toxin of MazEF toxin-antitoxin module
VRRGDVVIVATRGACTGKLRPALVVQSDLFNETHASITVCPVTSDAIDAPLFASAYRRVHAQACNRRRRSWSTRW